VICWLIIDRIPNWDGHSIGVPFSFQSERFHAIKRPLNVMQLPWLVEAIAVSADIPYLSAVSLKERLF
jgi:hypothetical protein